MNNSSTVPRALKCFLLVAFVLDAFGLFCEAISRFILHLGFPYRTPILWEKPLADLQNFAPLFQYIHKPEFFSPAMKIPYMYPAPVAPLYGVFFSFSHPRAALASVIVLIYLGAAFLFGRRLHRAGLSEIQSACIAGAVLLLSYGALFEFRQGNMEIFVFLLIGLGVFAFLRERLQIAAMLFGVAGAMKLFPFVYLGLFLVRRRYSPILTAAATAVGVTLISLRYLDPQIAVSWHGISNNIHVYQDKIGLRLLIQTGYDHSLFGLIKTALYHAQQAIALSSMARIQRIYLLSAALTGVAAFFLRIRKLPIANQVLCLCVASILLPPISFDYTLIHLYIPFAMFAVYAVAHPRFNPPGFIAVFFCLAVATSIETEIIWRAHSLGGQIKALDLIVLFIIGLRYPFKWQEHDDQMQSVEPSQVLKAVH